MSRTRQLSAFAVICLGELLIVLDMTIIDVALPQIGLELRTSITGLQWVVDAYTLTFSGFLLAFGNLGDRYGRKRMLIGGIAGLGLSSVIGAVATDQAWVLVSRALMGVFAAAVQPATLAIITAVFPDRKEKSLVIGIYAVDQRLHVAEVVGARDGPDDGDAEGAADLAGRGVHRRSGPSLVCRHRRHDRLRRRALDDRDGSAAPVRRSPRQATLCASSTISAASCFSQTSAISCRGARSPSIE